MMQVTIRKIKKRDGRIVDFDREKIVNAIFKAILATGGRDRRLAEALADKVVKNLESMFSPENIPSVEDVQDVVERVLIEEGQAKTAKAYIIYRQDRRRIREEKRKILQREALDEVDKALDTNSLKVLASRYLLKDAKGNIVESPKQLFERVATLLAIPDLLYDKRIYGLTESQDRDISSLDKYLESIELFDNKFKIGEYYLNKWHFEALVRAFKDLAEKGKMKICFESLLQMLANNEFDMCAEMIRKYYDLMVKRDFIPNSPTLMNAGARLGQLSACFVLDIDDDLLSIMKASTDAAVIFKSGGGVGINYSKLRPMGDMVASTSGVASGPISFMRIIDTVTDVVKQGGKRRGANMGILEVWHPDIEKFIIAKQKPGTFENFNISVGISEDFWNALREEDNGSYSLRNPRTNEVTSVVTAKQLFELIAFSAWRSAEPGVLFFDIINRYNVLKPCRGLIKSTNPCGEQPLYPYESCNLGSINLANFVKFDSEGRYVFDWQKYEDCIRVTTRCLDNVIDINKYPLAEIERNTKDTRKIGLGIMGLADLLFKLEIPYNSREGYEFMNRLAEALTYFSMDESVNLAKERGSFPLFQESEYITGKIPVAGYYETSKGGHNFDWDGLIEKISDYGIRNAMTTTVAPAGTISMIADTSNGVEPVFGLVYEKHVTVGKFFYVDEVFERALIARNLYDDQVLQKISQNYGSIRGLEEFPEDMQRIFVTSMDIHWSDHIMAQAIWQRWISASISKTINMPNDATVEDVKNAYLLAHELGLKGVTVYRDGSRNAQVLHIKSENREKKFHIAPSEYVSNYIRTHLKDEIVISKLDKIFRVKEHISPDLLQTAATQELKLYYVEEQGYRLEDDSLAEASLELCPSCGGVLIHEAGCSKCVQCGWSGCLAS